MKIYRPPKRDQRVTKKTSEGLAARPKKIIFHKKKNTLASWRQIDE